MGLILPGCVRHLEGDSNFSFVQLSRADINLDISRGTGDRGSLYDSTGTPGSRLPRSVPVWGRRQIEIRGVYLRS